MKISISLSTESIESAISKLQDIKDNLEDGLEQLVTVLAEEGADTAQLHYGDWNVSVTPVPEGKSASIVVAGDYPLMAEFGAGDDVVAEGFEKIPTVVRPASYSEQHAQQYATYGYWYFGGKKYYGVPPHFGLYNAKQYIIENSTEIAKEVIQL